MEYVDPADYPNIPKQYLIKPNDICIGMSGTIKVGINDTNKTCFLNQRVGKFQPRSLLNNKYLYYILCNSTKTFYDSVTGSSVKNLSTEDVKKLSIPLPPLSIQEEIVHILDNFSAITTDLSQGLPAEINARKKQYEYYRDRILTFKEKK